MANHKSAKKRAQQNEVRRLRNRAVKTGIRSMVKSVRTTVEGEDTAEAPAKLRMAQSAIDKAAKKGVYHHKKAARKVSRLARLVNTSQA